MKQLLNGIILVDKPAKISSAGVVARVKRILSAQRVGHAGTLDPDATGLLIVLVNGATRVASYAAGGSKVYSGEIQLGVTTTTDDLSGELLTKAEVIPDFSSVSFASRSLVGRIQQVPPKVSAKKIGGKRAYKLQRSGEDFELKGREVDVSRFDLMQTDDPGTVRYLTEVSPGTYVRSLARDLGEKLGCGAAVKSIRREGSGSFSVNDAISLEDVSWEALRDWSDLVPLFPRVEFSDGVVAGLLNGQLSALTKARHEVGSTLNLEAGSVVYSRLGDSQSLGILSVDKQGFFSFAINLA